MLRLQDLFILRERVFFCPEFLLFWGERRARSNAAGRGRTSIKFKGANSGESICIENFSIWKSTLSF